MNTLNIFSVDNVLYVTHAGISFPACEGTLRFDLDLVMKVVAVPRHGKWRSRLNAIEVTDYLSTLQKSDCVLSAATLWAHCWAIRKILDSGKVPTMRKGTIDWRELESMANEMAEEHFSFDLLKHAVKSAS